MTDLYAVVGNPTGHSKSPRSQLEFAAETKQDLFYKAILVPLDGFDTEAKRFFKHGGLGMNITVPFKQKVIPFLDKISDLSIKAGSVNTVVLDNDKLIGGNTDIIGFQTSLNKFNLKGKKA